MLTAKPLLACQALRPRRGLPTHVYVGRLLASAQLTASPSGHGKCRGSITSRLRIPAYEVRSIRLTASLTSGRPGE